MKTVIAAALGECVHVAGITNFLRLAEQAGWPCGACGHGRHAIPDHVALLRAALEKHLGVRLLNRTTRRVSLTAEGSDYLRRCRRILDEVRDAIPFILSISAASFTSLAAAPSAASRSPTPTAATGPLPPCRFSRDRRRPPATRSARSSSVAGATAICSIPGQAGRCATGSRSA